MKRTQPLAVDEELVRTLARLLDETGLTEIEAQAGDARIRIARAPAAQVIHAGPAVAAAPGPVVAAAPAAVAAADDPGAIKSPMVGTVYLSPQPNAPPFVAAGDRVAAGQTLMIVEAMKVMNPITAPRAGTVRAVLVDDGQPVEFGQPLTILD
ncbi:acetyl-CoA carboxylase biotin carboxyl carrier protein [Stella humosa]|uniref:Biotin carboxyl carrier protein of acetyl-CoA carboxylase n=1 Tax=Stella humosa TaxID=94 RepID=A0A3N1M7R1_9PROT|nr:acetyl-CoA carboxylase biotin carboxyl carrier protein [Stella humosa]ROP99727.1 acetyl-CoA carboxylase biotin carboxyl carrier protein [Stella humosa]BBK31046.1 acetyl-CoA carboxylase biotin carboxyl carrier protein subunit [Stella humosa]